MALVKVLSLIAGLSKAVDGAWLPTRIGKPACSSCISGLVHPIVVTAIAGPLRGRDLARARVNMSFVVFGSIAKSYGVAERLLVGSRLERPPLSAP